MAKTAAMRAGRYSGKVTPVGNSKGIRLDAAFFRAHPEFEGEVEVSVVADGQALLSAKGRARRRTRDEDDDPVLKSFLAFLERQMAERPDLIAPADRGQLRRIAKLIAGVERD